VKMQCDVIEFNFNAVGVLYDIAPLHVSRS
jgi:hypothetical protein